MSAKYSERYSGDTATEAQRQKYVHKQGERLEKAVLSLQERIPQLAEALTPVLRVELKATAEDGQKSGAECPHADYLRNQAEILECCLASVEGIIRRLEI